MGLNRLDGALAVVTGGSSGIGAAISERLAEDGGDLMLVARRAAPLAETADRLHERYGVAVDTRSCDLGASREVDALLAELDPERVEVLVCNAGTGTHGRFADLPRDDELAQLRVMCESTLRLCAAVAPAMSHRGSGAILIVSSLAGLAPTPNTATYGACKAFLVSLGQSLHAELSHCGVAVTTVCPGPVRTPFFEKVPGHPSERVFPRMLWVSPGQVADEALAALADGRRLVVPGRAVRTYVHCSRLLPPGLSLRLAERYYR